LATPGRSLDPAFRVGIKASALGADDGSAPGDLGTSSDLASKITPTAGVSVAASIRTSHQRSERSVSHSVGLSLSWISR
jgi:hypothetical protein